MKYLILGTDEAGYGPNLGPFVVACTQWELFHDNGSNESIADPLECLHDRLKEVVTDKPAKNSDKWVIGDSKKLYGPSKSLGTLSQTVFLALSLLGRTPKNWKELLAVLAPDDAVDVIGAYPAETCFPKMESSGILEKAGVGIKKIDARVIVPKIFNEALAKRGNKSDLLTEYTMGLIRQQISRLDLDEDVFATVICDKHGGRNRYLDILYHWFPEAPIKIVTEGRSSSIYCLAENRVQLEFRFLAKADHFIPTGLASMTAKLLRELAMASLNDFWVSKVPGLAPTAGYPADARRFYQAIEPLVAELNMSETDLWRKK